MLFTPKSIKKFQQGGEMPTQAPETEAVPNEAVEQDPLMQLAQVAAQALQAQDPNLAFQVCQGLVALVQQMGAVQEPQGEPVFKKGGILLRRIKK